jgi:alcohol dehydrogenase
VQALIFLEPGHLEWQEVEAPRLQDDGEALVRPLAVSSCDLDAWTVQGKTPFSGPYPFGHECVAEVAEVGARVRGVSPGELVSVPYEISCGTCDRCRRGQTAHCASVPPISAYGLPPHASRWGGFLSDLVRVPYADHMLVPLPRAVDPMAVTSVSDNLVDAWRTVAPPLRERPGSSVLIVGGRGSGSIGLYAAAVAIAERASRVVYADRDEARLELAWNLGAEVVADPGRERLEPHPITVDASGDPVGLSLALRSTERDGLCTSVGIYWEDTPVPLHEMYLNGVTLKTGRQHTRPNMPEVFSLIEEDKLHPEMVASRVTPWESAPEAFLDGWVKVVMTRGDMASAA